MGYNRILTRDDLLRAGKVCVSAVPRRKSSYTFECVHYETAYIHIPNFRLLYIEDIIPCCLSVRLAGVNQTTDVPITITVGSFNGHLVLTVVCW